MLTKLVQICINIIPILLIRHVITLHCWVVGQNAMLTEYRISPRLLLLNAEQ